MALIFAVCAIRWTRLFRCAKLFRSTQLKAIEEMNKVTQQTAATSEESASAAEELSAQSNEMVDLVNRFTLKNDGFSSKQRSRLEDSADNRDFAESLFQKATEARTARSGVALRSHRNDFYEEIDKGYENF